MNKFCKSIAVLAGLSILSSMTALAHHASAPHFDSTITIRKEASFVDLKIVNPHSYIYFTVTENGQVQNWRCEMQSATQLKRLGYTADTFEAGQRFTLVGSPARREDHVCVTRQIILEDGTIFERNTNLKEIGTETSYASQESELLDVFARPQRLENGQPNISGNWRTVSFGRNSKLPRPRQNEETFQITPEGRAAMEGYDPAFDDPILRCHYVNLVKGWNHDSNVNQIEQTDDKIYLRYGFMNVERVVHLDQKTHPENIAPSDTGHSIGHWEGDTLYVHTTAIEPGIIEHLAGVKHSDQLEVQERFYIDQQSGFLRREFTMTDPLYLAQPYSDYDGQELVNLPFVDYGCTELSGANNIRPGETVTYQRGTGLATVDGDIAALGTEAATAASPVGEAAPKKALTAPSKRGGWKIWLACLGVAALLLGGFALGRRSG